MPLSPIIFRLIVGNFSVGNKVRMKDSYAQCLKIDLLELLAFRPTFTSPYEGLIIFKENESYGKFRSTPKSAKPVFTDPFVFGKLLLPCAITITDALRLFHHFPNPHTFMHNTLIRALSLSQTPLSSLHPFIQLRRQPTLSPDSFIFAFALKGVANSRHLRPGIQLHSQAFRHGFDAHIFVGTTLISMYAECGDSRSARQVFDEMSEPNVVTWKARGT
ncbi:hypothetical protein JHK85_011937 [Glycine max]|nr:hypothetical protein JHK85_011937 [Glycine max]